MANINDRVLARRQKDLDNFTEDYQARLEVMTVKHIRTLNTTWQNMATRLGNKIKAMYVEAGAIQDPKKLKYMQNKIARLEALQSQLYDDIKLNNAQAQPYFTGILKHQFEDSYYIHAFGLEQAAKVAVTVPILTPAQVLGVLANPWLPDGATYAQRLNANMANFAGRIRDSVATAVSDGLGWNQTAHLIQEKTNESYYNAVRLARTELTRAAGQGANYAYMQNADILDGKRWNAVKDSRTAPKDAANDGEIYDLDYDTTENPGAAGQRIPNHPNCRCIWAPVLSALGVQDKERIARDDTDTPTSWGKNIYTKAKTYREYAEKRGLPDLDDLLAKENPKKYLRPGETTADISRTVKRWTYAGKTISIATPIWEQVKAQPSTVMPQPTAADETAATKWADDIKARIAQGVNSEADIREVGSLVRQQVEQAHENIRAEIKCLEEEGQGILDTLNDLQLPDGPEYDAYIAKYHALSDKRYELILKRDGEKRDQVRDILKEVRPVGPKDPKDLQPWSKGSSTEAKQAVDKVREYMPTSWLEKSNADEMKAKKKGKRGYYMEADLKDYAARGYSLADLQRWGAMDRLHGQIVLSGTYRESDGGTMLRCAFHEFGHRMEDMHPVIKKMEKEFYARRTQGEELKWLGPGYEKKEVTRFDKFLNPYMGKDYGNKDDSFYELLSMGLEGAYNMRSDLDIFKDKDYADFIYGILAAL